MGIMKKVSNCELRHPPKTNNRKIIVNHHDHTHQVNNQYSALPARETHYSNLHTHKTKT
jgi:hypothetical protein